MAVTDIFSKRQARLREDVPDVYQYELPLKLRTQIVHIMSGSIGSQNAAYNNAQVKEIYQKIVDVLLREYGRLQLSKTFGASNPYDELTYFLMDPSTTSEECLDAIELIAVTIIKAVKARVYMDKTYAQKLVDDSIDEINTHSRRTVSATNS